VFCEYVGVCHVALPSYCCTFVVHSSAAAYARSACVSSAYSLSALAKDNTAGCAGVLMLLFSMYPGTPVPPPPPPVVPPGDEPIVPQGDGASVIAHQSSLEIKPNLQQSQSGVKEKDVKDEDDAGSRRCKRKKEDSAGSPQSAAARVLLSACPLPSPSSTSSLPSLVPPPPASAPTSAPCLAGAPVQTGRASPGMTLVLHAASCQFIECMQLVIVLHSLLCKCAHAYCTHSCARWFPGE